MIAAWYAHVYAQLERIAWRHGYALALHGSMGRDLDVIAIPWTDDADEPEKLLDAFAKAVVKTEEINYSRPGATQKPHGRKAYSFILGHAGHYIDLSIMPRIQEAAIT